MTEKEFNWNTKQIKALNKSIELWELRVSNGGKERLDDPNCSCCESFADDRYNNSDFMCANCPISLYVNNYGCHDTPYYDWSNGNETKEAAIKELDFIKKVLEAGS